MNPVKTAQAKAAPFAARAGVGGGGQATPDAGWPIGPTSARLMRMPVEDFHAPYRAAKRKTRLNILMAVLIVIGAVVGSVAVRYYGRTGIGYSIYSFHDHVYLPLRGELYVRGFPNTLVFWLGSAGAIAAAVASWIAVRSFVLRTHQAVLGLLIASSFWRGLLLACAEALVKFKWKPVLLLIIARREYDLMLLKISRSEARDRAEGRALKRFAPFGRLLDMLDLELSLAKLLGMPEIWEAVRKWVVAVVLFEIRVTDEKMREKARIRLLSAFERIRQGATEFGLTSLSSTAINLGNHVGRSEIPGRDLFTLDSICADLVILCGCLRTQISGNESRLGETLLESVIARRREIEQLARAADRALRTGTPIPPAALTKQADGSSERAEMFGQIAWLLAVYVACASRPPNPVPAEAYTESCEALIAVMDALPQAPSGWGRMLLRWTGRWTDSSAPNLDEGAQMLREEALLTRDAITRMLTWVSLERHESDHEVFNALFADPGSVISEKDLESPEDVLRYQLDL